MCDLNDFRAEHHMRQTKTAAHQSAVAEQLADLFRGSVGGDIEVFGFFAQQQVADAAAYQISLIARFAQAIQYFQRILTNVAA